MSAFEINYIKCSHGGSIMCALYRGFSMRLIATWHIRKKLSTVTMSSFKVAWVVNIKKFLWTDFNVI